jgi:hypothetical protein
MQRYLLIPLFASVRGITQVPQQGKYRREDPAAPGDIGPDVSLKYSTRRGPRVGFGGHLGTCLPGRTYGRIGGYRPRVCCGSVQFALVPRHSTRVHVSAGSAFKVLSRLPRGGRGGDRTSGDQLTGKQDMRLETNSSRI